MGKVSFNDANDVFMHLKRIKVDITPLSNAARINAMIKRRHKIVHEMDKNPQGGHGNHNATSINVPTVSAWVSTVSGWVEEIDRQISEPGFIDR